MRFIRVETITKNYFLVVKPIHRYPDITAANELI